VEMFQKENALLYFDWVSANSNIETNLLSLMFEKYTYFFSYYPVRAGSETEKETKKNRRYQEDMLIHDV